MSPLLGPMSARRALLVLSKQARPRRIRAFIRPLPPMRLLISNTLSEKSLRDTGAIRLTLALLPALWTVAVRKLALLLTRLFT